MLHCGIGRGRTVVGHVAFEGCVLMLHEVIVDSQSNKKEKSKRLPAPEEARGGRMPNVLVEMDVPVC